MEVVTEIAADNLASGAGRVSVGVGDPHPDPGRVEVDQLVEPLGAVGSDLYRWNPPGREFASDRVT